jgi:hypothetical protein
MEGEMDGAYDTYGREELFLQGFGEEVRRKETTRKT